MNRILIYRWKAYLYEDIIEAFHRLGYETEEMSQHLLNYELDDDFAEKMRMKLHEGRYAFVFTVNYFPLISEICHEEGILYVSWACDSPLISMYHASVFYDTNRIFHFDRVAEQEFYDAGVKNLWHLPLTTNIERNRKAIENPGRVAGAEHDISFIGRLYERNSYDRVEGNLPDYLKGYLDSAILAQSGLYGANIIDRILTPDILAEIGLYFELKKSEESFSSLGLIFETTTLGFKIAQVQRNRALTMLSQNYPHRVFLYTSVPTPDLMLVENMGLVDYWEEAPYIFHHTKVNLNLTIPNIRMGIPLRVWDVMGSAGACLTNYQAELDEYFTNGKELMWFRSQEEMKDRVDFLLRHEDERQRMAQRGLEAVEELGGYEDRLKEILRMIKVTS